MRKRVCLIDSENDGGSLFVIQQLLDDEDYDKIVVFVSVHSSTAIKDLVIQNWSSRKKKNIKPVWCENGSKNSMDFILVSWLGKEIKRHPKRQYIIYSNDTGYESCIGYWLQQGYHVRRKGTK